MPSVIENKATWESYPWPQQGDEWSANWNGSYNQWYYYLRPRLRHYLPTGTILEIAPGYGRWTQYLKEECDKLILVDLTPSCIEACKKRFGSSGHICYHVNDGYSLDMVEDDSIDFVFTYDSLPHCEMDVIESYLQQMVKKMRKEAVAFFHHSNMGQYPPDTPNPGVRGRSVTGGKVSQVCLSCGLKCIAQEFIASEVETTFSDCYSLIVRNDSKAARDNRVAYSNHHADAKRGLEFLRLYG